jgi:hypothetical protein
MSEHADYEKDERAAQRLRADRRDYDALYAAWVAERCGFRKAAQMANVTPKRARRLWEKGVPKAALPPILAISRGEANLPDDHAAALEAPRATQKAVKAVVDTAARTAAAGVAHDIATAMHQMTDAQTKLFLQSAKALEEESALVDNARRTALTMLGRLITVVRSSGPMMEMLAARISTEAPEMTIPQAFGYTSKLLTVGNQIVDLGESAISLRRKLMGEAEQTIAIQHAGQVELSREDAQRELEMVAALIEQANEAAALTVIDGGMESAG